MYSADSSSNTVSAAFCELHQTNAHGLRKKTTEPRKTSTYESRDQRDEAVEDVLGVQLPVAKHKRFVKVGQLQQIVDELVVKGNAWIVVSSASHALFDFVEAKERHGVEIARFLSGGTDQTDRTDQIGLNRYNGSR